MPTYEYACDVCAHQFEEFQSISAAPLKKCPKCGKAKLKRLIGTGSALIFKGSGFYTTDYRSEAYKKSADAEKPAAATTKDAGSDAKGAAKADGAPAAGNDTKSAPASDAAGTNKPTTAPKPASSASGAGKSKPKSGNG